MIAAADDITSRFAFDVQSVGRLRNQAKTDLAGGARAAAQQFEALFLNMMLKSMRDATPKEGLFDDSNNHQLYSSMLDSQLAQSLSKGKGIGLADMMLRQMQRQGVIPKNTVDVSGNVSGDKKVSGDNALGGRVERQLLPARNKEAVVGGKPALEKILSEIAVSPDMFLKADSKAGFSDAADFANTLWPFAADAGKALGVPAQFLLGQAALESAWGKREIRDALGNNSFNLFGIKAGKGWRGAVVEALTTEYVNGAAQKKTELFRAYDSYAESFKDYASLLRNNPRYGALFANDHVDATKFARALQQAGYATDPMYADKLVRVINSATLRQALA